MVPLGMTFPLMPIETERREILESFKNTRHLKQSDDVCDSGVLMTVGVLLPYVDNLTDQL